MVGAEKAIFEGAASFEPERPDVYGSAHPKGLLRAVQEEHEYLLTLSKNHVASAAQFERPLLTQLFRLAAKYEANPDRFATPMKPLSGKLLISAFYEPSTRTRLSFESAWHRLGGDIMSITDRSTTGIAKGESLSDVAEMFNNYGDCVVLRDNAESSVMEMMGALRIPIINAGNGMDEHPTQALADLYAIMKWRPDLLAEEPENKIRIGIVGVPNRMRTVRSLLTLLSRFSNSFEEVVVIHDDKNGDVWAPEQKENLLREGLNIRESDDLDKELPELDVVYINAIAWVADGFEVMGKNLKLDKDSPLKKDSIILHPLARGDELCTSLDDTAHNWYFAQARGAVFMRMALLTCIVQRTEMVMDVV
ncbi:MULTISPECIES: aspartate/ornithine carbamoyltransferase family protein [Kordiimonas]|jgi:aspartate carbamoyltransferase catalytic subunit|uniref:Aspartate carbamoyltransferase catalytic subunit n=1 Tax=Kordiimonas lacus TaxID=637679 RepID=A0A1G7AXL5_9PROT|nr:MULTISPECIES: aspartate carbamoyltransferase [Kordiimonas]SDE19452.1 aspartate carbamoyltransferase catalytic subunit [Kordiimonas lacus]